MLKVGKIAREAFRKRFVSKIKYCHSLRCSYPHKVKYVPHQKHVKAWLHFVQKKCIFFFYNTRSGS